MASRATSRRGSLVSYPTAGLEGVLDNQTLQSKLAMIADQQAAASAGGDGNNARSRRNSLVNQAAAMALAAVAAAAAPSAAGVGAGGGGRRRWWNNEDGLAPPGYPTEPLSAGALPSSPTVSAAHLSTLTLSPPQAQPLVVSPNASRRQSLGGLRPYNSNPGPATAGMQPTPTAAAMQTIGGMLSPPTQHKAPPMFPAIKHAHS